MTKVNAIMNCVEQMLNPLFQNGIIDSKSNSIFE